MVCQSWAVGLGCTWSGLGNTVLNMNDEMPINLPRYVFRRANGSFRYKRNVPKHLRALLGKDTLYRQLGDSYREAMQALPLVHARVEALLNDETNKSARERSVELIRGALGDEVAELVLAEAVPEYSPIEDALNHLGKALHKQLFSTYFVENQNLAKKEVLLQAVEKASLDPVEAGKVIDERSFSDQVDEAWKRARQFQVTGVPSFISGSYATTGYHPYEELAKFIEYVEMQKARGA